MPPKGWIKRFEKTEYVLHWAHAVPYLILLITGLSLAWEGFEGEQRNPLVGTFHEIVGVFLILLPIITTLAGNHRVIIFNVKQILSFTEDDKIWIKAQRTGEHTPQWKFNFGQKMNSIVSMLLSLSLQLTGVWLWISPQGLLPRWSHIMLGFFALFALSGHLFMATLNPSTKKGLPGIFNGWVPRDYMEEHHHHQLDEIERGEAND